MPDSNQESPARAELRDALPQLHPSNAECHCSSCEWTRNLHRELDDLIDSEAKLVALREAATKVMQDAIQRGVPWTPAREELRRVLAASKEKGE